MQYQFKHGMKYLVAVIGVNLCLLCFALFVCLTPLGPFIKRGAPTPEAAILAVMGPSMVQKFQVRTMRPVPGPHKIRIVLYTNELDGRTFLNYASVEHRRWGWYFASGGGLPSEADTYDQWVDYGVSLIDNVPPRGFLVYGRTLAAEVAAVEVTFTNRQVLHDQVTDGVFAVVATGANISLCHIRVFDSNGNELQRTIPRNPRDDPRDARCSQATSLWLTRPFVGRL